MLRRPSPPCHRRPGAQELHLLTQMGWTPTGAASEPPPDDGSPQGAEATAAAAQLELDVDMSPSGVEAAEAARLKLQLSVEEWHEWERRNVQEERQRIREQLKQRFEEFCERSMTWRNDSRHERHHVVPVR